MTNVSNGKNIKKGVFYVTILKLTRTFVPVVCAPFIARRLGVENVGIYSFLNSIAAFFMLFASLGTSSYGMREIARTRDNKHKRSIIFWEIEIVSVITSLVTLAAWFIMLIFTDKYTAFFLVLSINIISVAIDINWFFNGLEEFLAVTQINVIVRIFSVVSLLIFVRDKSDLLIYFIIMSLTELLCNGMMFVSAHRFLERVKLSELSIKKHFKETFIYFVPSIATSMYSVLDKTFLGFFNENKTENGYYEQAENIINIAKGLAFNAINTVYGARVSYLFANEEYEKIKKNIYNSVNLVMIVGFGCMFGLLGTAKELVPIYLGEGYDGVVDLLYILSPIIIIIGISNCLGNQYYSPAGKRRESARYILIGACINVVLNLLLIPFLASRGASIASIMAEIIITILYLYNSNEFFESLVIFKCAVKKILAGIIMFVIIIKLNVFENRDIFNLIIKIVVGILIYFASLILLRDKWIIQNIKKGEYNDY